MLNSILIKLLLIFCCNFAAQKKRQKSRQDETFNCAFGNYGFADIRSASFGTRQT